MKYSWSIIESFAKKGLYVAENNGAFLKMLCFIFVNVFWSSF